MSENGPRDFEISDAAKAKILSILDDMRRFDPSETWIAAVVCSTSQDVSASITGAGPGIAAYPEKEIAADRTVTVSGLRVVFPNSDQGHFIGKSLDFDYTSDVLV